MTVSIQEAIVRLCRDTHVPKVEAVFGTAGVDAIFQVMKTAQKVYAHIEPERIPGTLIIFQRVSDGSSNPAEFGQPIVLATLANSIAAQIVLETNEVGTVCLRPDLDQRGMEALAQSAVVYRYSSGKEEFLAGTERMDVFRIDPVALSQFSVPTFANLREALQHYNSGSVRESTCLIFRKIWKDTNRLFLKVKPEAIMRDSLTQFLKNRLGADYDVMPEQNVDESHPVDIRISPRLANSRLMLIEIKWLGDSAEVGGKITVSYRDARAQDGADQLAGYIDKQKQSTPNRVCHGYYVVIDARRKGLVMGTTKITKSNGLYYENRELHLNPAHHKNRDDFDEPYRMFARPICVL